MSRRPEVAIVAICGAILLASTSLHANESQATAAQQWAAQLGGDDFLAREEAADQLVAAGADALEPLKALVGHKDAEVSWRARRILIEIAAGSEEAVSTSAVAALQQLAAEGHSNCSGLDAQVRWWRDVRKMPHQQQVQHFNQKLIEFRGGIDPFFLRRFRGC